MAKELIIYLKNILRHERFPKYWNLTINLQLRLTKNKFIWNGLLVNNQTEVMGMKGQNEKGYEDGVFQEHMWSS